MPKEENIANLKTPASPEEDFSTKKKKKIQQLNKLLEEVLDLPEQQAQMDTELFLRLIAEHKHKSGDIQDLKDLGLITEEDTKKLIKDFSDSVHSRITKETGALSVGIDEASKSLKSKVRELDEAYDNLDTALKQLKLPPDLSQEIKDILGTLKEREENKEEIDLDAFEERIFSKISEKFKGSHKIIQVHTNHGGGIMPPLERLTNVRVTNPQPGDTLVYQGEGIWVNGTGGTGTSFTSVEVTGNVNVTQANNFTRYYVTVTDPVTFTFSDLQEDNEFIIILRADCPTTLQMADGSTITVGGGNTSSDGGTAFSKRKGSMIWLWGESDVELQTQSTVGTWSTT